MKIITGGTKNADSSDWFDARMVKEKPSRLSGIVFVLLCVLPIFSTVAYGAVDLWALGAQAIFAEIIIVFWAADAWTKKEFQFSSSALQIPLFALTLIVLIQLLPLRSAEAVQNLVSVPATSALSLDPFSTRFGVVQLIIYCVFFAAAYSFINNQSRLRKMVFTVIIFGAAMALFGTLQRLANAEAIYGLRPTPQAKPFASFINQHHFAALMEMTIGLALGLLFGRATKKDKNLLLVIALVLMGIAVVFTGSRGGIISLTGVVTFSIIAHLLQRRGENDEENTETKKKYRRNLLFVGSGVSFILLLFGSVFLLGGDQSLVRGIGLESGQSDFSSGRTHFWQVALKIIADYPILGVGFNGFGVAFTKYDTWNGNLRVEQAHNDYLQILADTGILGFSCVVGLVYLLFRRSLYIINKSSDNFRRNTSLGALAGCFGVLLHSFFDFPLRTPANGYFFLILIVLATTSINYPKLYRQKRGKRDREDS